MSPLNENELRDELWFAHDPGTGPDPAELSSVAMTRGRAIRRRRIVIAIVAAVLSAVLIATVVWAAMRPDDRRAVPIETPSAAPEPWQSPASPTVGPTPSASAPPTPTPAATTPTPTRRPSASARPTATVARPTASGTPRPPATGTPSPRPSGSSTTPAPRWGSRTEMPGTFGDLGTFRLPHQGSAGYEAIPMGILYCDAYGGRVTLPALAELEAGRHLDTAEGEAGADEAILVFRTEAAAASFLSQLRTAANRCAGAPLPDTRPEGLPRTLHHVDALNLGTDGLAVGTSDQLQVDGRWQDSPGGSLGLWTRQGRAVIMAGSYGEYVGDVYAGRPDVVTELRGELNKSLPQLCRWTSAGC